MAPNPATIAGVLRQIIHYHIDNDTYNSALFFAERLSAQDPRSGESAHLLSLCHLRLGDARSAYDVGKSAAMRGANLGSAWVFAQASLALEKFRDGITALEKVRGLWAGKSTLGRHGATSRAANPDAAAVLCLLAKLHRGMDDKKKAVTYFEEALRHNPFMWDAFTALCDMGVAIRVPGIFGTSDALTLSFDQDPSVMTELVENIAAASSSFQDPFARKPASTASPLDFDPFGPGKPSSSSQEDRPLDGSMFPAGYETNDFMSRLAATRKPLAPNLANAESAAAAGMGTPATASSNQDPYVPPPAPARKTRAALLAEADAVDPSPKITSRVGNKRLTRAQERIQQDQSDVVAADAPGQAAPRPQPSASTTERKRTLHGHPVQQSRPGAPAEDPTVSQRRSARLNLFRPSSMARSGPAPPSAPVAARELKKARPQMSRMMRAGSGAPSVGRVVSGNRKVPDEGAADADHGEGSRVRDAAAAAAAAAAPMPQQPDAARTEEALKWIMGLVKKMANGYFALAQFHCSDAIRAFGSLPRSQLETAWVQAQIGRAHFERAAYADAEKHYRRVRQLAPTRLEDMEMYSSALWHLKRDAELSFLAHELLDVACYSPQAWCALGNAWSLAKDPEQAIRCFARAAQLNPKFAYAFTLKGHEHVAAEEYERALTSYRQAISADNRHYNAYYGIGRVYERLGSFDKAYAHYQAASIVNPTNAVLVCMMGSALEKQKDLDGALECYTRASALAPKAALTRYKKARALLLTGHVQAAQEELLLLKDLVPTEARVHFLLGKLYRYLGERPLAVRHMSIALALDPKAAPQIKECLEGFENFDGGMNLEDSLA